MNWLSQLLSPRSEPAGLERLQREAITKWRALPPADLGKTHFETRYVVINTEASGLNADTDTVLSVGAIALDAGTLVAEDSYHASLTPDPVTALVNLLTFSRNGPVVVYNAGLNRRMLERMFETHLGFTPDWIWLDLYWLLPALFHEHFAAPRRLADWMQCFGIETFQRHHALGDAYAIAQVMLATEAHALRRGLPSPRSLTELERNRRKLSGR